jgi:hypothetical protein
VASKDWELTDYTKKRGGYIRLTFKGQRVADFFPFAKESDEVWVRAQAQLIIRTMNGEMAPKSPL